MRRAHMKLDLATGFRWIFGKIQWSGKWIYLDV